MRETDESLHNTCSMSFHTNYFHVPIHSLIHEHVINVTLVLRAANIIATSYIFQE